MAKSFEDRLEKLAENYRSAGYAVTVRPGPDSLPDFAKDFQVELVASKGDSGVLVSAKPDVRELEGENPFQRYAAATRAAAGWRYDLVILEPEAPTDSGLVQPTEPSEPQIRELFVVAERLMNQDLKDLALVAAWSACEAVMRRRLHSMGRPARSATNSRSLLNELVASGVIAISEFQDLERIHALRNLILHGFDATEVDERAGRFVLDFAKRLLSEPSPVAASA